MTLPLINQFLIPYEFYNTRQPTDAEVMDRVANGCHSVLCVQDVKLNLIDIIDTPNKAAEYLFKIGLRNQITGSIENSLNDERSSYKSARRMMCSTTPSILSSYQNIYSHTLNMTEVDAAIAIASQGNFLSNGQILFHGGGLLNHHQVGLSTSH
ncbi:hypothetical protein AB7W11_02540 [Providencia manganoxydans]|uniref:hypothetical protein n=1 Tax=Providencia manganoxydans TaxID=2923283 RepID=UPI0034E522BB